MPFENRDNNQTLLYVHMTPIKSIINVRQGRRKWLKIKVYKGRYWKFAKIKCRSKFGN